MAVNRGSIRGALFFMGCICMYAQIVSSEKPDKPDIHARLAKLRGPEIPDAKLAELLAAIKVENMKYANNATTTDVVTTSTTSDKKPIFPSSTRTMDDIVFDTVFREFDIFRPVPPPNRTKEWEVWVKAGVSL